MKVLIDINLLFEIKFLVLSIVRKLRFVGENEICLKRKTVEQVLNEAAVSSEFSKDLFRTARFRFEGFEIFKRFRDTGIDVLCDFEEELAEKVFSGNGVKDVRIVKWENLQDGYDEAWLCDDEDALDMQRKAAKVTVVKEKGSTGFDYEVGDVGWQAAEVVAEGTRFEGLVTTGFGRGSREIGFPTANVDFKGDLNLVPGVYAGVVELNGQNYKAAVNIGWCPYYENKNLSYEIYILHKFTDSLVGLYIKCDLHYYIRSEASFRSLQDLIQAITLDVNLCDKLIQL